ncbi:hypothetical protein [Leucobacter sp. wl10]|uniref:hypothetical protein n=1 Tax=Leucobacter sp. wl10 TaxID=2304677 RepID=UPI0013C2EF3C|nr:hypothetical protein [Leucobacter sp. wl10]
MFAALCTVLSLFAVPTAAQANPSAGFNPGQIISDANFYDGGAMPAEQIQSFLNQQVPRCTIGDPGRLAWSPYGSTMIAGSCLKDIRFSTASRAANAYCGAYPGGTNETAATIISKVGRACGISPKVLMVMLEKEQSLITDTWPTVRQYDRAMGYACPDSGPNNSANCDPSQTGFAQQVYRAAWQLQVYRANPAGYNYRPFQTNTIQWNPNAGCGTSRVYIENWATAALYIYTPYRPNQAALDAGWGTGNSCSSYGNRNFYNFYKQWFGSPVYQIDGRFAALYQSMGGAQGELGYVADNVRTRSNGDAGQLFQNGGLYWSAYAGAQPVVKGFHKVHLAQGGLNGRLGVPFEAEQRIAANTVKQDFRGGSMYWSKAAGTHIVYAGAMRDAYRAEGGHAGYLGVPVSGEAKPRGGMARQDFVGGSLYWSRAGTYAVKNGAVMSLYRSLGEVTGRLGLPTSAERKPLPGMAVQDFEGGAIFWSSGRGASMLQGAILQAYRSGGKETDPSYLGAPVGGEDKRVWNAAKQSFDRGAIYWTKEHGAYLVRLGGIRDRYLQLGDFTGSLGLPVSNEIKQKRAGNVPVAKQQFENATIYWSRTTGAQPVRGGILKTYVAQKENVGDLGSPLGPERRLNATQAEQRFEKGTILWTTGKGGTVTLGDQPIIAPPAVGSPAPPQGVEGTPGGDAPNPEDPPAQEPPVTPGDPAAPEPPAGEEPPGPGQEPPGPGEEPPGSGEPVLPGGVIRREGADPAADPVPAPGP